MDSLHDPLTDFQQKNVIEEASRMFNRLASSITPAAHPKAIILGGQPGAGKTSITRTLAERFQDNVMIISGDDFRNFHPNHQKLVEKYGRDATPAASAFSGAVAEYLIGKAGAGKYNLIIEGTLRTADVPLRTGQLLKRMGYTVDLACMAVRPEVSYASTLYRYEMMREYGTTPRATSREAHDQTVQALPANINTLYGTGVFDAIRLHLRDGSCVYDSTVDSQPPAGRLLALHRAKWSLEDTEALLDLVERTEFLMAARHAPELPMFLRERAALLREEQAPAEVQECPQLE